MHFSPLFLVFILFEIGNFPSVYMKNSNSDKFLGTFRIPKKTPDPININSKKAKKVDLPTPFNLHATLGDKVKVVNNGKSVEIILDQKFTISQVTGGVLGDDIYKFKKIKYLWTDDINGIAATTIDRKGYPLENVAIFYNEKYGTFKNALNYRDGLAEVDFFIDICSAPNPLFIKYEGYLKQLRKSGSKVKTTLGTAIVWFAGNGIIVPSSSYYAYPGSYVDENTDKRYYCSTVIILPHLPQWCLSKQQYDETFGSFRNSSGQPLTNTESQFPRKMPVVEAKGILNSNTP